MQKKLLSLRSLTKLMRGNPLITENDRLKSLINLNDKGIATPCIARLAMTVFFSGSLKGFILPFSLVLLTNFFPKKHRL